MQKGLLVVCGDAADGLADSMYAGTVFLGGKHGELGADAVFEDVTAADRELLAAALERWQVPAPAGRVPQNGGGKATLELPENGQRIVEISVCDRTQPARSRKSGRRAADS